MKCFSRLWEHWVSAQYLCRKSRASTPSAHIYFFILRSFFVSTAQPNSSKGWWLWIRDTTQGSLSLCPASLSLVLHQHPICSYTSSSSSAFSSKCATISFKRVMTLDTGRVTIFWGFSIFVVSLAPIPHLLICFFILLNPFFLTAQSQGEWMDTGRFAIESLLSTLVVTFAPAPHLLIYVFILLSFFVLVRNHILHKGDDFGYGTSHNLLRFQYLRR